MDNTKILIGILTTICSFWGYVASAQENTGTTSSPLTRGFAIQNNDNKIIVIVNISENSKNWTSVRINPRSSQEFTCGKANYVRISTRNSGKVEYKIDCNKGLRYAVEWDRSRNLWDIYKLNE